MLAGGDYDGPPPAKVEFGGYQRRDVRRGAFGYVRPVGKREHAARAREGGGGGQLDRREDGHGREEAAKSTL